jgi:ubiquinone/menaquinone biosynthesis C-methylase UbiE
MDTQNRHAMLPKPTHDEEARQMFVKSFRGHLSAQVAPGNRRVYNQIVVPKFERSNGRSPNDKYEVRKEMEQQPYYQFWSAMQRASQELMWDSVIDTVERTLPELQEIATQLDEGNPKGSLTLDETLIIPSYHTGVDIHLQPGAYHSEFTTDDLAAGAIYDRGVYLYLAGATGPHNDLLGRILVNFYKENFADRKVSRILDMGCAIGNSTLPWAEAFPDAEVHGIDVGAPVLRYAHARAEAKELGIHFSQQNAELTNFADGSFDLIVSHIMLHETSHNAMPRIFAECARLLRPGGLMLHLEIPRDSQPFDGFMMDWEAYNNNEPFSRQFRETDVIALVGKSGLANARLDLAPVNFQKTQRNYSNAFPGFPVVVGEKL